MNGFILLPLHITSLGGTEVEVGVIMGLYNAIGIVCQPLVGPWVDALGRRPFMLLGVGLALVAALLAAAVPEIGVLALVRVLQWLAFSCFFGANYSYVRVFGGRLSDVHGRRAVIVPSMFAQAGATALLAAVAFLVSRTSATPVVPVLFLTGLLAGGAHGFLYPGLAALVTDHTPETRRGVVVGIFSAVFLAGQTTGAFVFGYVTHAIGYAFMWSALTSLLLLGAALALKLERK